MHIPTVHRKPSISRFFASYSYQTFADNEDISFSVRLSVLKLYDSKCDTVENVHFEGSVSNPVFVLRLLKVHELITSFSTSTYIARGPNFARRCVAEGRCHL